MLRALLTAAFALLLTSCAHERSRDTNHPVAQAAARFVIQALPPTDSAEEYRWDAFNARVASAMQWTSAPSSAPERGIVREGRLTEEGIGVVATGDASFITALSIDTDAVDVFVVLDAIRQAGADVSFQGDYESYSEYIVTPPGRDFALLTANFTCIPFDPQPRQVCRHYLTLTFNPY